MKMYENLLTKLKNAAKARKESMAIENGFSTVAEFKSYLETQIKNLTVSSESKELKTKVKPTIHVIDIIDCSTSMSGSKHKEALIGINEGIKSLKQDTNANFTYTICNFGDRKDIQIIGLKSQLPANEISFKVRGCTALYKSICEVFKEFAGTREKVLMNIYTDGEDNDSTEEERTEAAQLIKKLNKKNFTITFIGTRHDTAAVQRLLNIDASNTLSYDGTGEGLKKSLQVNNISRSTYSAKVAAGEDVRTGFYKTIVNK